MPKTKPFNYHAHELSQLKPVEPFAPSVKFWDGQGNSTKTMDLNAESIPEVIKYLKQLQKQQNKKAA